jgi:protein-S-isoprenylcysteine O-methyltransferase Ste14
MSWRRNLVPRAALSLFILSLFLFPIQLYEHFEAHITGSISGAVIEGEWLLVVLNIFAFTLFLVPLSFRRKVDWKGFGLVGAFFVSLFVEMYGIPFTILLASKYLGIGSDPHLHFAMSLSIGGIDFGLTLPMVYGAILMIVGTVLIIVGWITLFQGVKKGVLVTHGIYSFSRHPQYLGFIMVVMGWVLGWPTIITLILGPVLAGWYVRTCFVEEREMERIAHYADYRNMVPFLI